MVAAAGAAPSLTGGFQNFGFDAPVAKPLEEFEQRNVIITFFPSYVPEARDFCDPATVSVLGKAVVSSRMLRTFASGPQTERMLPQAWAGPGRSKLSPRLLVARGCDGGIIDLPHEPPA